MSLKQPQKIEMRRDPVIVGIYRVPCHGAGHVPFQHASPQASLPNLLPPPPLRMWTTRKLNRGLTLMEKTRAPSLLCTSLYGAPVQRVSVHCASKRCPIYVFVDPPAMPIVDARGSVRIPSCGGDGEVTGFGDGSEWFLCESLVVRDVGTAVTVPHQPAAL